MNQGSKEDDFFKNQEENSVPQWLFGRDSSENIGEELRRYQVDETVPFVIFLIKTTIAFRNDCLQSLLKNVLNLL